MLKKTQKGFTLFELLICVVFLLGASFLGWIIYLLFHFISKFW